MVFDNVQHEKEKAMARFNRFRRIAKLWQFLEVLVVLGLIQFLIGNTIIFLLFMLCRQSESSGDDVDIYDDYVKYSEVSVSAQQGETALPPSEESGGSDWEKQIVVRAPEAVVEVKPQCDDVAVAIERARRRIKRFERTQSEKLKREILVRRQLPELQRSETGNRLETVRARGGVWGSDPEIGLMMMMWQLMWRLMWRHIINFWSENRHVGII
ncbi:hypothetical protein CASFOL_041838 [Castilleja foliolosa]|uniref:Uncharacterized protein n=1 Tax=Castilleja foliolosa TaxID=1961234 RepID=A0ABD3B917_9LAMI